MKRERRMFPFICLGNKVDLRQRTSIKQEDLVEEQEVADLLEELCPVEDLRADVNVKKRSQSEGQRQDLQPSALPSGSASSDLEVWRPLCASVRYADTCRTLLSCFSPQLRVTPGQRNDSKKKN